MKQRHCTSFGFRLPKPSVLLIAISLTLVAGAAAAWLSASEARVTAVTAGPSETEQGELQHLVARCERAMLQGRCAVMTPGPTATPESRVFIAGSGEVDAGLYAELRRYGDAMCGEVRTHCRAAWNGAECRIARALYP